MGGEQQKDGRAAAGQGCNHPLPLQPGSERKDQCPVLWAQRQLFSPQLLLPFTTCQLAAVEERAMACIARLLAFSNTCPLPEVGSPGAHSSSTPSCLPSWSPSVSRLAQSLGWAQLPRSAVHLCCLSPQVCSCFTGAVVLRHQCTENQRFPVLGKLAGQLILCCTSTDEGTRDEAMKAVRQLFIFIASQSERSCVDLGAQVPRPLTDIVCSPLQECGCGRRIPRNHSSGNAGKRCSMNRFPKRTMPEKSSG